MLRGIVGSEMCFCDRLCVVCCCSCCLFVVISLLLLLLVLVLLLLLLCCCVVSVFLFGGGSVRLYLFVLFLQSTQNQSTVSYILLTLPTII